MREFATPLGSHSAPVATPVGEPLTVPGWQDVFKQSTAQNFEQCTYGIIAVNRDWFDIWLRQSKADNALLESKCLIYANTSAEIHGQRDELMQSHHLSGFEPLEQISQLEGETYKQFLARIRDPRIKLSAERRMIPSMARGVP
jgi:hypothetical protein